MLGTHQPAMQLVLLEWRGQGRGTGRPGVGGSGTVEVLGGWGCPLDTGGPGGGLSRDGRHSLVRAHDHGAHDQLQ